MRQKKFCAPDVLALMRWSKSPHLERRRKKRTSRPHDGHCLFWPDKWIAPSGCLRGSSSPLRWDLPFAVLFAPPPPSRFFIARHASSLHPPLSPFPNPSLLSCCPRPDLLTVSPLPETTVAFLVMPGGKEHFLRSGARVSLTPLRSVLENRSVRHDLMNVQLQCQLFTRVDIIPTGRYRLKNKAEIASESPVCT